MSRAVWWMGRDWSSVSSALCTTLCGSCCLTGEKAPSLAKGKCAISSNGAALRHEARRQRWVVATGNSMFSDWVTSLRACETSCWLWQWCFGIPDSEEGNWCLLLANTPIAQGLVVKDNYECVHFSLHVYTVFVSGLVEGHIPGNIIFSVKKLYEKYFLRLNTIFKEVWIANQLSKVS